MSLDSWNDEFYWIKADVLARHPLATDLHLLRHAELKWIGLRRANLQRHRFDPGPYQYNPDEALCVRYRTQNTLNDCARCPVAKFRGDVSCHSAMPSEAMSPWGRFVAPRPGEVRTPEPMIELMRAVYTELKQGGKS